MAELEKQIPQDGGKSYDLGSAAPKADAQVSGAQAAGAQAAGAQAAPKERSWGEAFADVAGHTLSAIASGKKGLAIVASATEAALNTDSFQAKKNEQVNEAKKAELQLNILRNQNTLANLAVEDARRNAEQAKVLDPLRVEEQKNRTETSKHDVELKKIARQNAEKAARYTDQNLENQAATLKANTKSAQAEAELKQINAEKARLKQLQTWQQNWNGWDNEFWGELRNRTGYDNWNLAAQANFDNSPAIQALSEANMIIQSFRISPEMGKAALVEAGWNYDEKTGKIFSEDGKYSFGTDEKSLREIMLKVNEQVKLDIAASVLTGQDSRTLEDFTYKMQLTKDDITGIFGRQAEALRQYRNFVNYKTKIVDKRGMAVGTRDRFSKAQKLGHVLATSISGAVEDGKISEHEKATLAPLMAAYVKKFGGEVIWGKDIASTRIKTARGDVDLMRFARDLRERDVIGHEWAKYKEAIRVQIQKQEAEKQRKRAGTPEIAAEELSRLYGAGFVYGLPKEELPKLKSVFDKAMGYASRIGAAKTQDGKAVVPDNVSLDTLKKASEFEQQQLKDAEYDNVEGFFTTIYNIRNTYKEDMDSTRIKVENEKAAERTVLRDAAAMGFIGM